MPDRNGVATERRLGILMSAGADGGRCTDGTSEIDRYRGRRRRPSRADHEPAAHRGRPRSRGARAARVAGWRLAGSLGLVPARVAEPPREPLPDLPVRRPRAGWLHDQGRDGRRGCAPMRTSSGRRSWPAPRSARLSQDGRGGAAVASRDVPRPDRHEFGDLRHRRVPRPADPQGCRRFSCVDPPAPFASTTGTRAIAARRRADRRVGPDRRAACRGAAQGRPGGRAVDRPLLAHSTALPRL